MTSDFAFVLLWMAVMALPMIAVVVLMVLFVVRGVRAADDPQLRVVTPGDLLVRAHVMRPGQDFSPRANLASELYGVLLVRGTDLVWQPEAGPGWQTPVHTVTVTAVHGAIGFASPSTWTTSGSVKARITWQIA